jgi:mannosyltransferase
MSTIIPSTPKEPPRVEAGLRFEQPWLAIAGAVLMVVAAIWRNSWIEAAFGRQPHSLSWGPALFRAVLAVHGFVLLGAGFVPRGKRIGTLWERIDRRTLWILSGITVVAILLRIPALDSCLWLDEVLTMVRFARPPVGTILTSFPDQNQHMLYSLLAHGSIRAFGEYAWALRLPSVLFGAGSLWTLFVLGRRIVGKTEALLACGLMAVSYHHIWFSQNARGYMGLLFFTNLATWLWLKCFEDDNWSTWLAYAVSVALGFWIHMTMLFVALAHALIWLVVWLRGERKMPALARAAAAFALCGSLVLQLHALVLPEFFRTAMGEFSPPSEWTNPLWVVTESMRSLQVGFAGVAVVFGGLAFVAAGWLDILRRNTRAAWAMVLPGALGGGITLAMGHNLWPRFFFFCMGFALLIAIHGAMMVPKLVGSWIRLDRRIAIGVGYALAGVIIAVSIVTIPRAYALPKQDYTGARDFVEHQRQAGDEVVSVGLASLVYSSYYAPSWQVAKTPDELASIRAKGTRTFLVYTLPVALKSADPDIWKIVQSDFETLRIFPGTLGGGEVVVCRSR